MKSSKEIAEVFRALGDPTRIEILRHLQSGEKTTTELSELMELSQSVVTHHITVLYMSRLLGCRREGKWVYYSISPAGVNTVKTLLAEVTSLKMPEEKEDAHWELKEKGNWSWSM
ncbi:MAG: winged helix-turn-helix transcriptional regulator [Ruminococcaceae bacterium]|nr:winged helix-turn-helix transcriptional regulator [Oscillospiraceae bacterium]